MLWELGSPLLFQDPLLHACNYQKPKGKVLSLAPGRTGQPFGNFSFFSSLFFPHTWGPGTQICLTYLFVIYLCVWLVAKHLYPLCHLAAPSPFVSTHACRGAANCIYSYLF